MLSLSGKIRRTSRLDNSTHRLFLTMITLVATRRFAQYILRYEVRQQARQSRGSGIGYFGNWPIKSSRRGWVLFAASVGWQSMTHNSGHGGDCRLPPSGWLRRLQGQNFVRAHQCMTLTRVDAPGHRDRGQRRVLTHSSPPSCTKLGG